MRTNQVFNNNPFKAKELLILDDALLVLSDISVTGLRVYVWIRENCFKDGERIYVYINDIKVGLKYKETKSVYNGINDLLRLGVIGKSSIGGEYFYNKEYFSK